MPDIAVLNPIDACPCIPGQIEDVDLAMTENNSHSDSVCRRLQTLRLVSSWDHVSDRTFRSAHAEAASEACCHSSVRAQVSKTGSVFNDVAEIWKGELQRNIEEFR